MKECLPCLVDSINPPSTVKYRRYDTFMTVVCGHCKQLVCAMHSAYTRCTRTMNVRFHCLGCEEYCHE